MTLLADSFRRAVETDRANGDGLLAVPSIGFGGLIWIIPLVRMVSIDRLGGLIWICTADKTQRRNNLYQPGIRVIRARSIREIRQKPFYYDVLRAIFGTPVIDKHTLANFDGLSDAWEPYLVVTFRAAPWALACSGACEGVRRGRPLVGLERGF